MVFGVGFFLMKQSSSELKNPLCCCFPGSLWGEDLPIAWSGIIWNPENQSPTKKDMHKGLRQEETKTEVGETGMPTWSQHLPKDWAGLGSRAWLFYPPGCIFQASSMSVLVWCELFLWLHYESKFKKLWICHSASGHCLSWGRGHSCNLEQDGSIYIEM